MRLCFCFYESVSHFAVANVFLTSDVGWTRKKLFNFQEILLLQTFDDRGGSARRHQSIECWQNHVTTRVLCALLPAFIAFVTWPFANNRVSAAHTTSSKTQELFSYFRHSVASQRLKISKHCSTK